MGAKGGAHPLWGRDGKRGEGKRGEKMGNHYVELGTRFKAQGARYHDVPDFARISDFARILPQFIEYHSTTHTVQLRA